MQFERIPDLQTGVVKNHLVAGRRTVCCVLYSVPQKGMEQLRKHAAVEVNN